MRTIELFAGIGGGILGGLLNGHRCVCAVEINDYCQRVLMQRQDDGILPPFPIWPDVRTFDGRPWRGHCDVVAGGFPCTDISQAVGNALGIDGPESGLWAEMARIICEVAPRFVFVENSPSLAHRGLDRVLGDLAGMGYDARWGVLGGCHAGSPQLRERMWILAYANHAIPGHERNHVGEADLEVSQWRLRGIQHHAELRERGASGGERHQPDSAPSTTRRIGADAPATPWSDKHPLYRMAPGAPVDMDRVRACGMLQIPAVAALAWRLLGGPITPGAGVVSA